jgi:hypothetical protein
MNQWQMAAIMIWLMVAYLGGIFVCGLIRKMMYVFIDWRIIEWL